jgi:hypothetical protein
VVGRDRHKYAGRRVVGASGLQAKPLALARLHVTGAGALNGAVICRFPSLPQTLGWFMARQLIPEATVKRVWPIGVARRIRKTGD